MFTFLAENAIAAFVSLVGTILATYLVNKVGHVMDTIEMRSQLDIDEKFREKSKNIVRQVVLAISQSFVSGLRERGKFTKERQAEALDRAIKDSGRIIFEELGIVKSREDLEMDIEAEIACQKEAEKLIKMVSENEDKKSNRRKGK